MYMCALHLFVWPFFRASRSRRSARISASRRPRPRTLVQCIRPRCNGDAPFSNVPQSLHAGHASLSATRRGLPARTRRDTRQPHDGPVAAGAHRLDHAHTHAMLIRNACGACKSISEPITHDKLHGRCLLSQYGHVHAIAARRRHKLSTRALNPDSLPSHVRRACLVVKRAGGSAHLDGLRDFDVDQIKSVGPLADRHLDVRLLRRWRKCIGRSRGRSRGGRRSRRGSRDGSFGGGRSGGSRCAGGCRRPLMRHEGHLILRPIDM